MTTTTVSTLALAALSLVACAGAQPRAAAPASTASAEVAGSTTAAPAKPCVLELEPGDAASAARALAESFADAAFSRRFVEEQGRPPAIRFREGRVKPALEAEYARLLPELEAAFRATGKVEIFSREAAPATTAAERGADAAAAVHIITVEDHVDGRRVRLFLFGVEMIDTASSEKVWLGDHQIQLMCEDP
jgi:hypothetical protein